MDLSDNKTINRRADYEKLYRAAVHHLADIHDMTAHALEGLEEMYLKQTEPIPAPGHIKLAGADDPKDNPT